MNTGRLRVTISCDVPSPAGGVEGVIIGLVSALGKLQSEEEYVLVVPWQRPDWITPFLGENQRIVTTIAPIQQQPARNIRGSRLRKAASMLTRLKRQNQIVPAAQAPRASLGFPLSDGFYESLNCEVLHIPFQNFVLCSLPTIYNPHDLQHLHYPEFFSPAEIARRDTVYSAGVHFSQAVAVASNWVQQDICDHYHVPSAKTQVIPWAPPTEAIVDVTPSEIADVQIKYKVTGPFAFYPAYTWPHKNHLRLLEGLALVRDRWNLKVTLVCCGLQTDFWTNIEQRLTSLQLNDQVQFIGHVTGAELRALYSLSQFVIVPSLFEAACGPLYEAWSEGVPAACSSVTSLPEQAGEAALLFDPLSIEEIADVILTLSTRPEIRQDLKTKGAKRLEDFSWQRTAKAYRALYRRIAGRILSEEDRLLLNWDWMRNPKQTPESD